MNPFHLIWQVPLGLFALLVFLLLLSVRVRVVYEQNALQIWAGYGPGNLKVYPRPKKAKKPKKAKPRKEKAPKKAKTEKKSNFLPPFTPENIFAYLKMIMDTLGGLLRQIRVPKLKLHLTVGNADAAKTAITYGTVSAAAGTVLPPLEKACRIRQLDVFIQPDFAEGKQEVALDVTISATPLLLLLCVLKLGIRFLRYRRAYFKAHPALKEKKSNKHTDSKKGGSDNE